MAKGFATKRPVQIEFWRWGGSEDEGRAIVAWIVDHGRVANYIPPQLGEAPPGTPIPPPSSPKILIETLEGPLTGSVGDCIIQGVHGEFYACKPDIFEETYQVDMEG